MAFVGPEVKGALRLLRMTAQLKIISATLFLIFFFGCAGSPVAAVGGYQGGVVDAASGESLEGAVVVGIWYKISIGPGGGYPHYLDARETVSDADGRFSLPGFDKKAPHQEFRLLIFKAGYEALGVYGPVPWGELKEGGILEKEIQWDGDRPTISLRKLSRAEIKARRLFLRPMEVPEDKMPLLMQELAEESRIKKMLRDSPN